MLCYRIRSRRTIRTSLPAPRLEVSTEPQPDVIHETPQVEHGIQQVLGNLPVEIMSEIFLDIAEMEPEQFTFKPSFWTSKVHPIMLVCRFWYHLARQTPSLWGRIFTVSDVPSHKLLRQRTISRVKERLLLAKGPVLDIHIRIDFSGGPQSLRLWDLLFERIQDWKRAVFVPTSSHDLKVLLYQMLKDPTRAQSLTKLTIEPTCPTSHSWSLYIAPEENQLPISGPWDDMPKNIDDFNPSSARFPRLQHLRADSACESLLSAVGPDLESLQVRCYSLRSLARVLHRNLLRLPKLKLLHFEERRLGLPSIHFEEDLNDDNSDNKCTPGSGGEGVKFNFPQLEQCYWIGRNDGSLDLRLLHDSPMLSRLSIRIPDTDEESSDPLFFKSSPLLSVTELHLQFPSAMDNITRILEVVPNLVTLSLQPLDDQSWYYDTYDVEGNQERREKAIISTLDNLFISRQRGSLPTPLLKTVVIVDRHRSPNEKTKCWIQEHDRHLQEDPGLFNITIKEGSAVVDLVTGMNGHLPLLSSPAHNYRYA